MTKYVVDRITRGYLQQYDGKDPDEPNYDVPNIIWLRQNRVPLTIVRAPMEYGVAIQLVADLTDEQLTEYVLRF